MTTARLRSRLTPYLIEIAPFAVAPLLTPAFLLHRGTCGGRGDGGAMCELQQRLVPYLTVLALIAVALRVGTGLVLREVGAARTRRARAAAMRPVAGWGPVDAPIVSAAPVWPRWMELSAAGRLRFDADLARNEVLRAAFATPTA